MNLTLSIFVFYSDSHRRGSGRNDLLLVQTYSPLDSPQHQNNVLIFKIDLWSILDVGRKLILISITYSIDIH